VRSPLASPALSILLLATGLLAACSEPKYADLPDSDDDTEDSGTPSGDDGDGGGADGADGGDDGEEDPPVDTDGDGVPDSDDCRPEDPDVYPGNDEIPYDGIDQDCFAGDLRDVDGDGYDSDIVGGPDCDDDDASINPDSFDDENGFDDDCDGLIDEDAIINYESWPVHIGKDNGTARGLLVGELPAGGAAIAAMFEGEIDIDPSGDELVPRESQGAGEDIIVVAYDSDRELVTDFAISSDDALTLSSIETDGGGGYLLSGSFGGTVDFDDATPTFVRRSEGGLDGWFARFSDTGGVGFAYSIGGSDDDSIAVATDTSAGTIVAGHLVSGNLNVAGTAPEAVNVNTAGLHDGYIAAYDFTQALLWYGLVGGDETTDSAAVVDVVEDGGTLYVLGRFTGTVDLDPDEATDDSATAAGAQDVFLIALDATTGVALASATLGGAGATLTPVDLETDGAGTLAVVGTAEGTLDLGAGSVTTDGVDIFAVELSTSLAVQRAQHLGGAGEDTVGGVAFVSGSSDLMLAGSTDNTLAIGTDSHTSLGGTDCWVGRLGADDPWLRGLGSTGDESCPGIAAATSGDVWLAGSAAGPIDFGTAADSDPRPVAGDLDAWVHLLSTSP
jgi:hypothetical protein